MAGTKMSCLAQLSGGLNGHGFVADDERNNGAAEV
jgi:hypothetical protein